MADYKKSIIDLFELGHSEHEIADMLNLEVSEVADVIAEYCDEYDDSMDGDHASALASVGWGTDEDYGSYSDDW